MALEFFRNPLRTSLPSVHLEKLTKKELSAHLILLHFIPFFQLFRSDFFFCADVLWMEQMATEF